VNTTELDHLVRLTEAAAQYEDWGWTTVPERSRLLLLGDNNVSAIEIGRGLGGEVQSYLAVRLLAGPVAELPGTPTRWLFFISGFEEAGSANFVRVRARGGLVHGTRSLIPLPPSRIETGEVAWLLPPLARTPPMLPPFTAVVGALRAVTESAGLS
jgi:hypothetical protein